MNKIEVGQFRCDSHMDDVIYEIVAVDRARSGVDYYRVIYHVLDGDDGGMMINNVLGLKSSYDLDMWFEASSLLKDPLWREELVCKKKIMPSF
jgi:hypothetical protein